MLASFRSALLMVAALTATIIAPARAGPSGEPLLPATNATPPTVVVPDLLNPNNEPTLSQPDAADTQTQTDADQKEIAQLAVKAGGDLASMVAQLRGADPGNRELE